MEGITRKGSRAMNNKDMSFVTKVDVEIWHEDHEKDIDDVEIMVPYDIDFEYRSWGLKSIYSRLQHELTIEYVEKNFEDETEIEKSVTIKPNELKREYNSLVLPYATVLSLSIINSGGYGTPERIVLNLNKDDSVDYDNSTFYFGMGGA